MHGNFVGTGVCIISTGSWFGSYIISPARLWELRDLLRKNTELRRTRNATDAPMPMPTFAPVVRVSCAVGVTKEDEEGIVVEEELSGLAAVLFRLST